MLCQVPILGKSLATELSSVGLLADMNSHMVEEVPSFLEGLVAVLVLTAELSSVPVCSSVFFKEDFKFPVKTRDHLRHVQACISKAVII